MINRFLIVFHKRHQATQANQAGPALDVEAGRAVMDTHIYIINSFA